MISKEANILVEHVFMRAIVVSLGCKVNQYEGEVLAARLEEMGIRAAGPDESADIFIINTCSVTSVADHKSRKLIRKAIREHPDALVIVTGCYAQIAPEELRVIPGIAAIVPQQEKDRLPEIVEQLLIERGIKLVAQSQVPNNGERLGRRVRAFIKVQDGCDHFCSYCVIPFARSRLASKPIPQVMEEIELLARSGVKEVVLAGIRLAGYGKETRSYFKTLIPGTNHPHPNPLPSRERENLAVYEGSFSPRGRRRRMRGDF